MDTPTIESNLARLPMREDRSDDQTWEGREGQVRFMVTRGSAYGYIERPAETVTLTVSGPVEARHQLISDFAAALGQADSLNVSNEPDAIDSAHWLIHLPPI